MPTEDKQVIYRPHDPDSETARLAILRVGHSEAYPNFRIKRPAKSAFTLKIVLAGQGFIQSHTTRQSYKAGDVVLYWKGNPYEWWTDPHSLLRHYWIDIDGPLVPELFAHTLASPSKPVLQRPSTREEEVGLIKDLMTVCTDRSPTSFWRCLSSFYAVWHSVVSTLPTAEACQGTRPIAVDARAFIDMHYTQRITLQDIADAVGVAPGYLSTLFAAEYSISPYAYAIRQRLELAHSLLGKGCKVQDVANSVGYLDTGYFTRLFRRHYGYTPSSILSSMAGSTEI